MLVIAAPLLGDVSLYYCSSEKRQLKAEVFALTQSSVGCSPSREEVMAAGAPSVSQEVNSLFGF